MTDPGTPFVSPDDLAGITPLWEQAVQEQLLPVVAEVYQDSAGTLHAQLIDATDLPSVPPVTSLASEAYLAQAANTFQEVGADLWETARGELLDGMQAGESIPQLRDRLRTSAGLTGRTATMVARTQVLDAANAGSYDTARVAGLDLLKGWEATPDARTRDTHAAAGAFYQGDGMIALTAPFTVGGFQCERPHDPVLPPAERYNCRCTLIYAMPPTVPTPPVDRQAELEAWHQQRVAQIRAAHEARVAEIARRHEQRLADLGGNEAAVEAIEARHAARLAKLNAAYEARRAALAAERERRLAEMVARRRPLPSAVAPQPTPGVPSAGPVAVPIRPALLEADTVRQVQAVFLREWAAIDRQHGLFRARSARFIPDGDVQTAREHAEGLLRAIERFPRVPVAVSHRNIRHYAQFDDPVVQFGNGWARDRVAYLASLADGSRPGLFDQIAWRPAATASPQGVAMHEFGHALHRMLSPLEQDLSIAVPVFRYSTKVDDAVKVIVRELAAERDIPGDELVKREIGEYAASNTSELIGEAFADAMVRGEGASILSRRIMQVLVDEYDRAIAGGRVRGVGPVLPTGPRPARAAVADDGLDELELHSLRSLAVEFEVPNVSRLGRPGLLRELRKRNVVLPAKARELEAARLQAIADAGLARSIAEALQAADQGRDLPAIIALLEKLPLAEAPLTIARRATTIVGLRRSLEALATRHKLTLPTSAELQALRVAERKAAREAAAAARAEKARQAAISRQVKAVERGDFSSLTRVGPQGGGMPGGLYEDAAGGRWYVKQAASEDHARNEALGLALYRAAGLDAPEMVIGGGAPGLDGIQVATRFLPDAQVDLLSRLTDTDYIDEIRRGFAVDAWLANWDIVGANPAPGKGWDNIVSSGGRPWRIDAGGALRFRGLGGPKGNAFGREVLEWDTLRDATMAERASQVFSGMTRAQLKESIERVKAVTPAKIRVLVRQHGLDDRLATLLIERRADLLERALREIDIAGNFRQRLRTVIRGAAALRQTPVTLSYRTNVLSGLTPGPGVDVDEIRVALLGYRGWEFRSINGELRAQTLRRWVADRVDHIDAAMDRSPLLSDILGFRTLSEATPVFGSRTPGDLTGFEWLERGYLSMSVSRAKANSFMGYGREVMLRILAPRGVKGLQLSDLTYEGEILLQRGLTFRVVADHGENANGQRQLDVEVVSTTLIP